MTELNVYHHELRHNEYAEFYLKYEADKVIAEKDKEIAELKDKLQKCIQTFNGNEGMAYRIAEDAQEMCGQRNKENPPPQVQAVLGDG